jgi:hypothetical protein
MSLALQVVEIEGELGVVFPDELTAHLGAKVGDTVVIREDNGVFHLSLRNDANSQKPES